MLLLCFGTVAQAASLPNNIVPDGRTATQLTVSGNTTSIATSSVSGATGFNSFSNFVLSQGNPANLMLPTGTVNLVNIVRNGQAVINVGSLSVAAPT